MLQFSNSTIEAAAHQSGAMEADTISKHGRNLKSHMSKGILITEILIGTIFFCAGCGGGKKVAEHKPKAGNPFGEVYEAPCSEQDTDEYFVGLGIANGSRNRMDVLQTAALTNAQNVARQKMQHAYKGAIDDYSNYMGNNMGSDAQAKVERGGTQIIDRIVNDTKAICGPKFSGVDERGDVSCYIGIRINKQQLAQAITNHLSTDEELKIRFNEQEFRKRMDESFQKFKDGK